jgi:hypothetical protein
VVALLACIGGKFPLSPLNAKPSTLTCPQDALPALHEGRSGVLGPEVNLGSTIVCSVDDDPRLKRRNARVLRLSAVIRIKKHTRVPRGGSRERNRCAPQLCPQSWDDPIRLGDCSARNRQDPGSRRETRFSHCRALLQNALRMWSIMDRVGTEDISQVPGLLEARSGSCGVRASISRGPCSPSRRWDSSIRSGSTRNS